MFSYWTHKTWFSWINHLGPARRVWVFFRSITMRIVGNQTKMEITFVVVCFHFDFFLTISFLLLWGVFSNNLFFVLMSFLFEAKPFPLAFPTGFSLLFFLEHNLFLSSLMHWGEEHALVVQGDQVPQNKHSRREDVIASMLMLEPFLKSNWRPKPKVKFQSLYWMNRKAMVALFVCFFEKCVSMKKCLHFNHTFHAQFEWIRKCSESVFCIPSFDLIFSSSTLSGSHLKGHSNSLWLSECVDPESGLSPIHRVFAHVKNKSDWFVDCNLIKANHQRTNHFSGEHVKHRCLDETGNRMQLNARIFSKNVDQSFFPFSLTNPQVLQRMVSIGAVCTEKAFFFLRSSKKIKKNRLFCLLVQSVTIIRMYWFNAPFLCECMIWKQASHPILTLENWAASLLENHGDEERVRLGHQPKWTSSKW